MADTDKKITILGTANRYLMKKVTENKAPPKKRVVTAQWNLSSEYYTLENQFSLLHNEKDDQYPRLIQQIERKVQGYKQQDVDKAILDKEKLIKPYEVVQMLKDSELLCHYCKEKMYIIYEHVREIKQWTLDRINNDVGHNTDNVFVSCLECNLKRRRCNSDKFLFTKQMVVVRS